MKAMIKRVFVISAVLVFGFITGWETNDYYYDDVYNYDKLEAYQHYYVATESMLDSVMYHYNIVDKVDTREHGSALLEVKWVNEEGK